jgi:hypothetical protein
MSQMVLRASVLLRPDTKFEIWQSVEDPDDLGVFTYVRHTTVWVMVETPTEIMEQVREIMND